MNMKLAFVLFAFAFVVAIVVGFGEQTDLRPAPAEFRARFNETVLKPRKARDSAKPAAGGERSPSGTQGNRRPSQTDESITDAGEPLNSEEFIRKYGDRLEFTQYDGRVIRIDGSAILNEQFEGSQRLPSFRSSSAIEVSQRAREVFENSRRLLGIPDDQEFIQHPPSTGDGSAQSIFQQSEGGVPLSPGGLVTILLGTAGEVRGIDSSIYPHYQIANTATRPAPSEAREILFVTQSAPIAVLRRAYETREHGVQKVVDAQTGAVLLEKDRKIR